MRPIFLALPLLLLTTSSAWAIECLNGQSADILSVEGWQLGERDGQDKPIRITLTPLGDKGIRLIDGTIRFEDVLGERIGEFILERAREIPPDMPYVHTDVVAGTILERLDQIHPDDIVTIACVSALVYDDGSLME